MGFETSNQIGFDYSAIVARAREFQQQHDYQSAIELFLYLAQGDPSLDGGTLRTEGACALSIFIPDFEQDYRGHEGLHVDFVLANVGTFEASGWAERNYVSRLHLVLDESGFSLQIEPTYGISLKLVAGSMKVEVTARGNRFVVRDVAT